MPEVADSKFGELYLNDEGRVAISDPDTGKAYTVPAADAQRFLESGWTPLSPDSAQAIEKRKALEAHSGAGSTLQTFAEGAARGVLTPFVAAASALPESLGGVPEGMESPSAGDVIETLNKGTLESSSALRSAFSGYNPEDVRLRAEANPLAAGIGQFGGELALFGAGGRLAGAGARALGAGAATGAGTAAGAEGIGLTTDVGSAAVRSSFGRRLLAQAAKEGSIGALQGAVTTLGLEHEAAYRERRAVDADALLSQMGMGAIIGGVLGAGLGLTAEAARTGFSALKRATTSGARFAEESAIQGARGLSSQAATDIGYGLGIAGKAASRSLGPVAQVAGTAANLVFRRVGRAVAERRGAVSVAMKAAEKANVAVEKAVESRAALLSELDDLASGVAAKKPEFATSAARLESAKEAFAKFESSIPRRIEAMERKHATTAAALESDVATAQEALKNTTAAAKRNADGTISAVSVSRIERARSNVTKAENALRAERARQKSARAFLEETKIPEQRAQLRAKVETMQARRSAQERTIRSKVSAAERQIGDAGKALDLAHAEIDKHIRGSLSGPTEQFLAKTGKAGSKIANAGISSRRAFNREFAGLMANDGTKTRKPPSVELEEHVENGRKALNRSVQKAFGGLHGEYKPVSGVGDYVHFGDIQFRAPGETPREAYLRRGREISMRTQDVMATSDEIARSTSGLDAYAPALGMKVRDSATKALVLLNGALKPVGGSPNGIELGQEQPWVPATTIDQAERVWNGTMFPGQIMDEFATWTMTPETVMAASAVYPDTVDHLRESIMEKMADGWRPTIKQQRQISLLTGAKPVQATPEYQARYQGYVMSQAQTQQPTVKPGDTGSPTIAQSFKTLSQSSMNIGSQK